MDLQKSPKNLPKTHMKHVIPKLRVTRNPWASSAGESSGSDDGAWIQGVDTEIAASKSKQPKEAPSTSSLAAKKGKQPEVPSASTLGRRPCPVPRHAPSADGDEDKDLTTRLFRQTTRAGKQETIDEAETKVTEKGNKSKGKTPVKNKKNTGGKKNAGK